MYKQYQKEAEKTAWAPLKPDTFRVYWNRRMKVEYMCPVTSEVYRVEYRRHTARGFNVCAHCESFRGRIWNAKTADERTQHRADRNEHWRQHTAGRDEYASMIRKAIASLGKFLTLAIDAADQVAWPY